ncbi:HlyD family secretion protein [Synechococcus sp. ROS8604]|uniref:HlyD family secretion protein n=1 Tax=Synechococcus sp. ROS8604 TaxID=1442557 RepID=UPI0018612029|nr:type I secretion system ABC transporter/ HlyD family [Synechococcus sp. ROS8604]
MLGLKQGQNALDKAVKSSDHDESVLQQPRYWMRAITWGLIGTTAFGVGWLCLAKTEEIVVATGKLDPLGAVKEIQMPVGGIADEILVEDGDRVTAGQVVMRLDTESSSQQLKSNLQSIISKEEQLKLKTYELKRYQQLNDEEVTMLSGKLKLENKILSRYQDLAEQGASSELQFLQQRNKVQEVQGKLSQTKVDRLRQTAILQQAIQRMKSELSDLQAKRTEAEVTLKYQALRSPVNGVVFDLKPRSTGYAAQGTETVMKIVPFDKLQANVEVPSRDIGFVRVGMPADISIDSFPATDFGVLEGTVKSVGSDALPPDQ